MSQEWHQTASNGGEASILKIWVSVKNSFIAITPRSTPSWIGSRG